jgi:glycosyltransferase involved in cell wall biosynthesis
MPEVSVIIPNYNHARFLQQRIDSVLAQTFGDFELIILDDVSTDNSREVIEQYRQHPAVQHIVYNTANSGSPFSQWEKGLQLAKGNWIWIAESDDFADERFLEVLLHNARSGVNIGISFCSSHWIDDNGIKGKELDYHKQSFTRNGIEEVRDTVSNVCPVQNVSSALIRKDLALKHIRGLHHYKSCGDWIFYTRLLHDADIVYTYENRLNYFRFYHNNITSNAFKTGYWVCEGIDVLLNIRFDVIRFTPRQVKQLLGLWMRNIRLNPARRWQNLLKILHTVKNYSASCIRLRVISTS